MPVSESRLLKRRPHRDSEALLSLVITIYRAWQLLRCANEKLASATVMPVTVHRRQWLGENIILRRPGPGRGPGAGAGVQSRQRG